MTLPIRTLPVVEKWDCQSCGHCCRSTTITLDETDLAKLNEQRWDEHPDFLGVQTVRHEALLGGRYVLAKKQDGSCVFLSDQDRCRIHELHGAEAKPAVCRMFPFQLVPLDRFANVTLRRSCPSAAADCGRPVEEHLAGLKKSGLAARFSVSNTAPPAIVRGNKRSWSEFLAAAEVLQRLTTDQRLPLVRRLVHGLRFCTLLEECKLRRVNEQSWNELMQFLETASTEDAGEFFRDRKPPSRGTALLFRQAAVHYIRSYPGFQSSGRWRERWRLMLISARFARGKGTVPKIHPDFPTATFDSLEHPLGPLPDELSEPLNRFFETHATSKQYVVVGRKPCLVDRFRALAFTYPMGMWLLRLAIGQRQPTAADVVDVVVALERGQGMKALSRGARAMSETQQLERLVAWYAR